MLPTIASPKLSRKLRSHNTIENCNSKLRDELLNAEIFYTLRKAKALVNR